MEAKLNGVAVWPTLPSTDELVSNLRTLRSKMPLVLLDRRLPGFESDFAGFDDRQIGRLVAEHLASIGHRSLGFIGWCVPETVAHHLEGFVEALALEGIQLDERFVLLTREDGIPTKCFNRFLVDDRPKAVFCANDLIAMELLHFLKEHGLSVPEDVAIVGVGDSMSGGTELFGLTTVQLPHESIGWEAADI